MMQTHMSALTFTNHRTRTCCVHSHTTHTQAHTHSHTTHTHSHSAISLKGTYTRGAVSHMLCPQPLDTPTLDVGIQSLRHSDDSQQQSHLHTLHQRPRSLHHLTFRYACLRVALVHRSSLKGPNKRQPPHQTQEGLQ